MLAGRTGNLTIGAASESPGDRSDLRQAQAGDA